MDAVELDRRLREALPAGVEEASIRLVDERSETLTLRRGVLQPVVETIDRGAMITVLDGGLGYAATSDLSASGLRAAAVRARDWARRTATRALVDRRVMVPSTAVGAWRTPVALPWEDEPLADRLARMTAIGAAIATDPRIVDWEASLQAIAVDTVLVTTAGGAIEQQLRMIAPDLGVTASAGGETCRRSVGSGRGVSQQGGLEAVDRLDLAGEAARLGREALELLEAPYCPDGRMDLILDADQMMLQIHESIGHPLELDRILGDERNYAGTSFVTLDMFGSYRYGSELLDVSFDPTVDEEFASYGWDDDGTEARRVMIIEGGILKRPLGSRLSQARAGIAGVANARASSWNRPPIDRMANLNIEPGDRSLEALIGMVERGVLMRTNAAWSIDDSRNKFQFGCEWGRLIEDGRLGRVVRNPNYRGISATFWRSLAGVGDASTRRVLGTPFCGKGEPNQAIRVGHASPVCLFRDVDVFGGAA